MNLHQEANNQVDSLTHPEVAPAIRSQVSDALILSVINLRDRILMMTTSYCPNCGTPLSQEASFCPHCGVGITAPTQAIPPSPYSLPSPGLEQGKPHSHDLYKVAIGTLLLLLVVLGAVWYATGNLGLIRSSLTPYHYQLSNPPNYRSIQPPNTVTPSPQYVTWNTCGGSPNLGCNVTANGWLEGTIPDTFDYFPSFTSTVPIKVYFFTLGQFVQFATCNGDVSCVSGYYDSYPATTSLQNQVFKLAEGCADYVSVFVATGNGVMQPNVAVARNPAQYPTGYCAQVGG